jgi:hypothetical protein
MKLCCIAYAIHGTYSGGMCFYLGNDIYINRAGNCSDNAVGLYSGDAILAEIFHGFPQSSQGTAGIVTQLGYNW